MEQVVCDIGFSTGTVSIVTYMLYYLFIIPNTSQFRFKLEKIYFTFLFLCVLLSIQRTGYSIQQTLFKKKFNKNKGKSVEKGVNKYGKSVEKRSLKNLVENCVE